MTLKIEKADGIGFCFGVKRAIDIIEKIAREHGHVETLGALVHNQQVLKRLSDIGVRIAENIDDITGNTVAIGAHGVSPQLEKEIRNKYSEIIDTTCPFVHRAQVAAQRLAENGFFVIIYGDSNHPEVKGILGWADGKGIATLEENLKLDNLSHRLGVLSQTTQIPSNFTEFVKKLIDSALAKDTELHITDTICHDIRERQQAALNLAKRSDMMLVIGSHTSANTNHLARLCATITETHLIENAEEIDLSWLKENQKIGITSGASTSEETINKVLAKLEAMVL
ncbi:4-hydroxy-3-methylbut-2-enyl diphosphate reductase [Chloroflexota bacterium]